MNVTSVCLDVGFFFGVNISACRCGLGLAAFAGLRPLSGLDVWARTVRVSVHYGYGGNRVPYVSVVCHNSGMRRKKIGLTLIALIVLVIAAPYALLACALYAPVPLCYPARFVIWKLCDDGKDHSVRAFLEGRSDTGICCDSGI